MTAPAVQCFHIVIDVPDAAVMIPQKTACY